MENNISLCVVASDSKGSVLSLAHEMQSIASEILVLNLLKDEPLADKSPISTLKIIYPREGLKTEAEKLNYLISKASGDWILLLDPTERVAASELTFLKHLAISWSFCFEFTIRNYSREWESPFFKKVTGEYPDYEQDFPGFIPGKSIRLFPNMRQIHFDDDGPLGLEKSILRLGALRVSGTRIPIHRIPSPAARFIVMRDALAETQSDQSQAALADWERAFDRAAALFREGKFSESVEWFLKAYGLNPSNIFCLINAGTALLETGNYEEAISRFDEAVRLKPESYDVLSLLGVTYLRKGDLKLAEKSLQDALKANPRHVPSHSRLGYVFMRTGKPLEAAQSFVEALKLMPQSGVLKADLGSALLAADLPDEALTYLREAVDDEPRLARAYFELGMACKMLGLDVEAVKAFDQYCQVERKNSPGPLSQLSLKRIEQATRESEELKAHMKGQSQDA